MQELRWKIIKKRRTNWGIKDSWFNWIYIITLIKEEINRKQLMIKKHEKVCITLSCIEHFLILASKITGCVFISAFSSLIGIPVEISSSWIKLKFVQ